MKATQFIIIAIMFMLFSLFSFAQTPEKLSYQAVVRDAENNLVTNRPIGIQISILQGSSSGTPTYIEQHNPTTNSNGLVSIDIGTGLIISGDFASIDWGTNSYFLKTESDLDGGTNYTIEGTSQLLSVPYALHAKSAKNCNSLWTENNGEIYYNLGNVGIGTSNPGYSLDVIKPTGEAYMRLRSNDASSSFIIDKWSVAHMGQIVYQQNHENKFFTGLLGSNDYWISTDRFSLIGLEVEQSGNVTMSDNLTVNGGFRLIPNAGSGKVLTSDASGNASWQVPTVAPTTKYLSCPGICFQNTQQVDFPTDHSLGYTTSDGSNQMVKLFFPVLLPHGASITEITITVLDNTSNNFSVKLFYTEQQNSTPPGIETEIVEIQSTGATDDDRVFSANLSVIDPFELTIDKDRVYYLKASWTSGNNSLYMGLKQVLITYVE